MRRSGQFVILHADGSDGSATRQPMLVVGLRQTPVRAPGDVWIEPGSRVRLEGTMQNGVLVLGDTVTAVTELAPARLAGGLGQAPSTETTAVVPFYLSDQTTTGLPADADATMTSDPKSLRAYYLEQTYGDIAFQTTVFAPVHLTQPKPVAPDDCTDFIDDWADEAESLNPTLDPAQYKHIVYVFPALASNVCGWSGIAEVGGSHVWINGQFNVPVIAHELGHNLGITHAAGLSCKSGAVRRSDGRHLHRRPGSLRAAAVRGSLRRDGQPARAAADEHAAQAGAGRRSRRRRSRPSARRAPTPSPRWRR